MKLHSRNGGTPRLHLVGVVQRSAMPNFEGLGGRLPRSLVKMRQAVRLGNFCTGLVSCTAANRAKYWPSTQAYRQRGCNFGIILV